MHYIPDASKALPYSELHKQPDLDAACANYIEAIFGQGVVHAIPSTVAKLHQCVVFNMPEVNAHNEFLASFGLAPKPAPAPAVKRTRRKG